MESLPLKYLGYGITFQEVPNETSLVINISGCPHHCEGCHSEYLWEYEGDYISKKIYNIINKYDGLFTCVCFMGGEQNIKELKNLFGIIKSLGYKTCLYSGLDDKNYFKDMYSTIDYLKIGRYIKELGGLDNNRTNQKFYNIKNNELIDITKLFRKE